MRKLYVMPTENLAERKVQMPVATTMPRKWHIARPPKMVPAMKIVSNLRRFLRFAALTS